MAALRNNRKLTVFSRESPESARNSQSQNTLVPDKTEEYITEVLDEIEGSVSKELSQEFSGTESRILSALSKLDEFFRNPQIKTCSGTVQGKSRNSDLEDREPTRDRSQNDPYPEVEFSVRQTSDSTDSSQEEASRKDRGDSLFFRRLTHCWRNELYKLSAFSVFKNLYCSSKQFIYTVWNCENVVKDWWNLKETAVKMTSRVKKM